jgi:hypothetical protein
MLERNKHLGHLGSDIAGLLPVNESSNSAHGVFSCCAGYGK